MAACRKRRSRQQQLCRAANKFGNRSILLTGDIEKAAETSFSRFPQPLRADVVKVPHHGSKTSSTEPFVLATKPVFAIVSVGRNSMFGHPHKEVVDRWQANGATVLTTGHSRHDH